MKIIVIGGGAAGFFGAISCAEMYPNAQIIILEAGNTPLTKVRISGGGRCNVTHSCFDTAQLIQNYPRGGQALKGAFSRFQPKDTVEWFEHHHVVLKTEPDGRMFPDTDDSLTIVNTFTQLAHEYGIALKTKSVVTAIHSSHKGFEIELKGGHRLTSDRVLLATGSHPKGHAIAHYLGHSIEPTVPSLFTFQIPEPKLHQHAGISIGWIKAQLHCPNFPVLKQEGPMLITHWGLSGPVVLKLSAWGARMLHACRYQATLRIHWCPQYSIEQVRERLTCFKQENPKRSILTVNPVNLPRRLWQYLVHRAGIHNDLETTSKICRPNQTRLKNNGKEPISDRWAHLSKKSLNQLAQELTQGEFLIRGKGVFKDEFVTCGGVSLKSVNFKTMESRTCPGLYFAGEILDIDGVTGGFNFQSAWTTGWIAGQNIGKTTIA